MALGSSIEWTDATWQVTAGCSRHSPGCQKCYAERMSGRLAAMALTDKRAGRDPGRKGVYLKVVNQREGTGLDGYGPLSGWNNDVVTLPDNLADPLRWKRPRRIFVNSQSDLFHADVPFDFVDRVFAVMALCPQHTFQVLTKRTERMAEYVTARPDSMDIYRAAMSLLIQTRRDGPVGESTKFPLPNVWLGTSVEDQQRADERIPHLLKIPAAVRFLSMEPLLGGVRLDEVRNAAGRHWMPLAGIDRGDPTIGWVIVGGESGPGARPFALGWGKDIVRQCRAAGVPVFVKQVGANPTNREGEPCPHIKDKKGGNPAEWPEELRVRELPAPAAAAR